MKRVGIPRRIDELGRVVIPAELRRVLDISEHDLIEIIAEEDRIILQKYSDRDIFTGERENLIDYCGKKVLNEYEKTDTNSLSFLTCISGYPLQIL